MISAWPTAPNYHANIGLTPNVNDPVARENAR